LQQVAIVGEGSTDNLLHLIFVQINAGTKHVGTLGEEKPLTNPKSFP